VKRDVIKEFLVPCDVPPSKSTLPTAEASVLANIRNCVTRHAARASATQSGSRGPRCIDIAPGCFPMNGIAAASWNPSRSSSNNNQSSRTPDPYMQGLAPSVHTFLTRVS
jgi:hypothetical protein